MAMEVGFSPHTVASSYTSSSSTTQASVSKASAQPDCCGNCLWLGEGESQAGLRESFHALDLVMQQGVNITLY